MSGRPNICCPCCAVFCGTALGTLPGVVVAGRYNVSECDITGLVRSLFCFFLLVGPIGMGNGYRHRERVAFLLSDPHGVRC